MGLRSVSASKDVIGDPSRPGTNNSELLFVIGDPSRPGTNNSELLEPRQEEREKVLGKQASFRFNQAGKK